MNDAVFCKNFRFNEYDFSETKHRDNSHGVDFHFLGLMKKGKGRIVCQKEVLELEEGDLFYIPKGCRYHSYWIAENHVCFDSIGFLYFPNPTPNGYRLQKIAYDEEIRQAFLPLSRDKSIHSASIGLLYHLLGLLESRLIPAPYSKDTAVCEKLVLLMKENPQMTVPEYAVLCGVSETLLYHYVKKNLQKSPNRLRQEILCEKAAKLLCTTNYTVEEICDKLAFASASYFRAVFKSVYHTTPSAFRREGNAV